MVICGDLWFMIRDVYDDFCHDLCCFVVIYLEMETEPRNVIIYNPLMIVC